MLIHSAMERRLKSMGLRGIFEQRGFPILTTDETVRDFKHLAMGIQVLGERTRRSRSGQLWKQTKPEDWGSWQIFMIACDDLEQFCGVVLYISHYMRMPTYYSRLIEMHLGLTVDIVAQDYHSPLPLKNDTAVQPSIQRLLEPLRRLHKVYTVLIRGPASETYKENVKKSIMREAPTAEEMITTACELKALGEDAFRKADFRSCVYTYEKAISDLEAGCQLCDPSTLVTEGKYSGSRVSKASRHLYFMLQLDLVTALLRLQSYDRAHNWTMVEAQMGGGVTSDAELAQMWYLRAQASREMGIIDRAHDELAQAVTLQPDRNDMAADFGRLTIEAFRSSKATMRWKLSSREYSYRLRTVRYMSLFFFATFSVFWWRRRP